MFIPALVNSPMHPVPMRLKRIEIRIDLLTAHTRVTLHIIMLGPHVLDYPTFAPEQKGANPTSEWLPLPEISAVLL